MPQVTLILIIPNTYIIIGVCGIDSRVVPTHYGIVEGNNVAKNFRNSGANCRGICFWLPDDVLVLDNTSIHTDGVNSNLEDWLCGSIRIVLLLWPARTPEWNPIELAWNIIVQRLAVFSLELFH